MRILAIETSCDETAIAIVDAEGDDNGARFRVLGNALLSQIDIHKEYGGVFPALAKREHAKNLVPILVAALEEAELLREDTQEMPTETHDAIAKLLEREPGLDEATLEFLKETEPPEVDSIAVTAGPGLEPALWVGINFAKALALAWRKPIVAVNHMEGHIMAALAQGDERELAIAQIELPVVALLVSGGHTELVLMRDWLSYELIGRTRDDAVGEAFDKVARMLALPYPGGPEISKRAEARRASAAHGTAHTTPFKLPRPMLREDSCDFSFAGLKTAVRNVLTAHGELSEDEKDALAREFEDAVTDVLWKKTERALEQTGARTLAIGGGVSANTHLRRIFQKNVAADFDDVFLAVPAPALTTDNALMIAFAAFYRVRRNDLANPAVLSANGNLAIASYLGSAQGVEP